MVQRLARYPLPPRLSRILVEAMERGVGEDGCIAAALLGSDGQVGVSDLLDAMDLEQDFHTRQNIEQLRRIARPSGQKQHSDDGLLISVLAAFPDRVARRRNGNQVLLSSGASAEVAGDPPRYEFMVALDAEDRKEKPLPLVRMTSRVEPEWLIDLFPDRVREQSDVIWNRAASRVDAVSRVEASPRAEAHSRSDVPLRTDAPLRPEAPPRRAAADEDPEHTRSAEAPWQDRHRAEGPSRWSEPPRWDDAVSAPPHWTQPEPPATTYPGLLPQRVPAEPDVPSVPETGPEPSADGILAAAPELARIATYLRDEDEEDGGSARPDVFDIPAVLAAVRVFPGVREAQVRSAPDGLHTLRLELADDADPAQVSREVARLLKERMGLAAEPNDDEDPLRHFMPASAQPTPPRRRRVAEEPPAPTVEAGPPAQAPPAAPPEEGRSARPAEPRSPERPADVRGSGPRAAGSHAPTTHGLGGRASGGRAGGARPAETGWAAATRAYPQLGEQGRDSTPPHRPLPGAPYAPRVVLDQVEVSTQGTDAVVEVRLSGEDGPAVGVASGPAFDGYVLRLAAVAASNAIDQVLAGSARCFIENATVVPLGSCEVAVVVLLLAHGGWVEELSGSAVVNGDQRQAIVRATLAAVNRRLEALLP